MDAFTKSRSPLTVDTNIAYHIDMSKFPGLDDPEYKYQPALLIASLPASIGAHVNVRVSPEIIPSPTLDLPTEVELLEDLLSIIDWEPHRLAPNPDCPTAELPTTWSCLPSAEKHSHVDGPARPSCRDCPRFPVTTATSTTSMSRYAMDLIFQKLIYPDFSNGRSVSFDSLVTSFHTDSRIPSGNGVQAHRRNWDIQGKRKRSSDARCTVLSKRQTSDNYSSGSIPYGNISYSPGYRQRPVHKRVRELMC